MIEEAKPPRQPTRIKSAPRIRQIYWSDFPKDAQLPEFWKRRPVLIISKNNVVSGKFSALPLTTVEQPNNIWAHEIVSPFGKQPCWVICNHIVTMACSRLYPHRPAIPRLAPADFQKVVAIMLRALPSAET